MIYELIEELAKDNSRLYKEATLRREVDNNLLKSVLVAALSPLIKYYIKKIPSYQPSTRERPASLTFALDALDELSSRKSTGNVASEYLKALLSSLNENDAKVIVLIIDRDLKCGVNAATVNKIWSGLIPETPYMRCLSGDWIIECENDKLISIKEIVNYKLDIKVKSLNIKTNEIEYKNILNHFNNGNEINWFTIIYEEDGVIKESKYITENHKVILNNGDKIPVNLLKPGDVLF